MIDVYDISRDKQTAKAIIELEQQLQNRGDDFETLLKLGKLYTLTSMGQQWFTLLNKAKSLKQDHPEVLKNLAIAHVDAHYQYKTALEFMQRYVVLRPADPFGHLYRGYLLLMLDQASAAIDSLEEGLVLEPENIYGLCKLARAYLARAKKEDRKRAKGLLKKLENLAPGHIRVQWLKQALK